MHKINNRGFTLIELLVVIAIIGILSSVVLASLNTAREKSRDARRVSDMKQLQLALELYFDSNSNQYPGATTEATVASTLGALVTQGFMAVLPEEPVSGRQLYYYISDASGTEYCIGADFEGTPPTPSDTCPTLVVTGGAGGTVDYQVGP